MNYLGRIARAHLAPGRFLFAATILAAGCSSVAEAPVPAPAPRPPIRLEVGSPLPGEEETAADLLRSARDARVRGELDEADRLGMTVVRAHPRTGASGDALALVAEVRLAISDFPAADSLAQRYVDRLPMGDDRLPEVRLLQARAMAALGDPSSALDRLLRTGGPANPVIQDQIEVLAGAQLALLGLMEIESLLPLAPFGDPLAAVVRRRWAEALYDGELPDSARMVALSALGAGVAPADSLVLVSIVNGTRVPQPPVGALPVVTIGAVLPTGGSPALQEFARLVKEGIDVAAATVLVDEARVEVALMDDGGEVMRAMAAVQELESSGAVGAVGFLEGNVLASAAEARSSTFPLVSPTGIALTDTLPSGTYSLTGADPFAATAMARYAVDSGVLRAAVIHARTPESEEEARAFETAFEAAGGTVAGVFPYDAGATFFSSQVQGAATALRAEEIAALGLTEEDTLDVSVLEPVAVFVPVPPEDLEFVAPQITFYGLDTLAIQVLGNASWSDRDNLATVDFRHTTGVVAPAPVRAGPGAPGYQRFKDAYESHFQRTLVSPIPALGYDAALILLEGFRNGGSNAAGVGRGIESIRDVEGATGVFSVRGSRPLRAFQIVRIDHGALIPIY